MKPQNYSNHVRMVPAFHYVAVPLSLIVTAASIVYLLVSGKSGLSLFVSLLLVSFSIMAFMNFLFVRRFACKVQDRAIRAEESLRYFALAGKRLDSRLTMEQIIALRFASDEEYLALCEKAANEGTPPVDLKRNIQTWRADHERV